MQRQQKSGLGNLLIICHVDLDCFYAQVEEHRLGITPTMQPYPLAVQQWDGLIAVNYAARALGVGKMGRASEVQKKFPQIHLVHVELIGKEEEKEENSNKNHEDIFQNQEAKPSVPHETVKDFPKVKDPMEIPIAERSQYKACLRRYRTASRSIMNVIEEFCNGRHECIVCEKNKEMTSSLSTGKNFKAVYRGDEHEQMNKEKRNCHHSDYPDHPYDPVKHLFESEKDEEDEEDELVQEGQEITDQYQGELKHLSRGELIHLVDSCAKDVPKYEYSDFSCPLERASIDEAYIDLTPMIRNAKELFMAQDEFLETILSPVDSKNKEKDSRVNSANFYNVDIKSNLRHFCKEPQNRAPRLIKIDREIKDKEINNHEQCYEDTEKRKLDSIEDADENFSAVLSAVKRQILSLEERSYLLAAYYISKLRSLIFERLGYTMSAGIANNKLMAKLASSRNKPNKLTIIPPCHNLKYMEMVPLTKLRGLGGKMGQSLLEFYRIKSRIGQKSDNEFNQVTDNKTVYPSDLHEINLASFESYFGERNGKYFYRLLRGIDNEPVTPAMLPNSMMAAKSFSALNDVNRVLHWIEILCDEICERVIEHEKQHCRRPKNIRLHYSRLRSISSNTLEKNSKAKRINSSNTNHNSERIEKMKVGSFPSSVYASNGHDMKTNKVFIFNCIENMIKVDNDGRFLLPCVRVAISVSAFQDIGKEQTLLKKFFSNSTKKLLNQSSKNDDLKDNSIHHVTDTSKFIQQKESLSSPSITAPIRNENLNEIRGTYINTTRSKLCPLLKSESTVNSSSRCSQKRKHDSNNYSFERTKSTKVEQFTNKNALSASIKTKITVVNLEDSEEEDDRSHDVKSSNQKDIVCLSDSDEFDPNFGGNRVTHTKFKKGTRSNCLPFSKSKPKSSPQKKLKLNDFFKASSK